MRVSSTAGLYAASTLGLLVLSGTIHLNAQMKTLPTMRKDSANSSVPTNYTAASNIHSLSFEKQELSSDEKKLDADQLVQKAATANKSAHYEKAISYYLEAVKKLEALSSRNPAVQQKIRICKESIARCYFYWAEQLYQDGWQAAQKKQFDSAVDHFTKAAILLPSSKKKMNEAIERVRKLQKSDTYVSNLRDEKNVNEAEAIRMKKLDDPELEGKNLAFSIDVKMRQGDAFYAEGMWTHARAMYEEVLILNPYHTEAIEAIRRTNKKLIEAGSRRRNIARQQYISEAIWTPVIPLIPRDNAQNEGDAVGTEDTTVVQKQQKDRSINEKLDKIIIPKLDFENELVSEVLKQLQTRSYELTNQNGVNIIYLPYVGAVKTNGDGSTAADDGAEDEKTITILNQGVTLRQAILSVCKAAGLKYKIEDHAVVIAPKNAPMDEHETRVFPIETSTYNKLVKEGSVRDFFEKTLRIPFSETAGVKHISGRLVVTNTPDNIQRIKDYLDQINKPETQVLVETKFMEVSMNDIEELGFQYQVSRQGGNIKYQDSRPNASVSTFGNVTNVQDGLFSVTPGENASISNTRGNNGTYNFYQNVDGRYQYVGSTGGGQSVAASGNKTYWYTKAPVQEGSRQLTFGPNSANLVRNVNDIGSRTVMDGLFSAQYNDYDSGLSINGAVRAIDQSDSADVLFCPRITTTNNYPATIKMVTTKYFPTDWEEAEVGTIASGGRDVPLFTSSIPELEEQDIGVTLQVQPNVSSDGRTITLPMKPFVREHVGWVDYSYPVTVSVEENVSETFTNIIRMPVFEDRVVNTMVACDDGETIILGGVVHDNTNSVDDQYPILGDIPLIGRLFQSKAKVSEKKNLLIFMTCRLINPDGTPVREIEMRGLPPFRQ